jgi:hypothetical protein
MGSPRVDRGATRPVEEDHLAKTTSRRKRIDKTKTIDVGRLKEMAEEATVDAYGESEQICGWSCMIDDNVVVPFNTTVLGATVTVEVIEQRGDTRIVAICKRGRARQVIDILELPLPDPPPAGAEWIEAYRHWRRNW